MPWVLTVVTSPPYALHFKKEYGNAEKRDYVDWLLPYAAEVRRVLTDDGSFVLNIGGSYNQGTPTRSLYHFRVLLMLCDVIADGLVKASKAVSLKVPLVVRLEGNRVEEGKKILADSGLPIISARNMADAAQKAVAAAKAKK